MRKSQTKKLNIFLLSLFYVEKVMFCYETYLEKLSLSCYIFIAVFSQQVTGNAVIKNTNAHIDLYWSCRGRTSTQNTC